MDFWPNPKANTQKTAEFAPDLTLTAFFDLCTRMLVCQKDAIVFSQLMQTYSDQ